MFHYFPLQPLSTSFLTTQKRQELLQDGWYFRFDVWKSIFYLPTRFPGASAFAVWTPWKCCRSQAQWLALGARRVLFLLSTQLTQVTRCLYNRLNDVLPKSFRNRVGMWRLRDNQVRGLDNKAERLLPSSDHVRNTELNTKAFATNRLKLILCVCGCRWWLLSQGSKERLHSAGGLAHQGDQDVPSLPLHSHPHPVSLASSHFKRRQRQRQRQAERQLFPLSPEWVVIIADHCCCTIIRKKKTEPLQWYSTRPIFAS